jgi:hypothetical protein
MNLQEKEECMEWFIEMKSNTQVQRCFITMYHKMQPSRPSIDACYKQFKEDRSVMHKKDAGPICWLARSPDNTPMIFFLWGYVKTVCTKLHWPVSTINRTELKLLLQQFMLTCCSRRGWSLNISWTPYI